MGGFSLPLTLQGRAHQRPSDAGLNATERGLEGTERDFDHLHVERPRREGPGTRSRLVWIAPTIPCLDGLYPIGYIRGMFTVRQIEEFVAWLDALRDKHAQIRIAARLR